MKALRFNKPGEPPVVENIPTPAPGPGQVRVRITAAGACHSDLFVMSRTFDQSRFDLPLTIGHEGVGIVDQLGEGVTSPGIGTPVAIYGPQGCGRCHACIEGRENVCTEAAALGIFPPGLGSDGTMAEYYVAPDARHLVPLHDLDPVQAVALTDAGLTAYHAIAPSLPKLTPGTFAVVIGIGGLGHLAVQLLRRLSPVTVIAIDNRESALELARELGAQHLVPSGAKVVDAVNAITGSRPVAAVFDFVVNQSTVEIGSAVIGKASDLVLVGVGTATATVGLGAQPYDATIRTPYWGSRSELIEVLNLARAGLLRVETEIFDLEDAPTAYARLQTGELCGRAVIVP